MDKFTVALISLIIVLVLGVVGIVLLFGPSPVSPQDDGNVTVMAIRAALADPGVAKATNNSFDKTCMVTNVSAYGDDGRSGLIGSDETLMKVSLMFSSTMTSGENRGLTVDVESGKIVGREQYFRRLGMPPYSDTIVVPPGASWYRLLNGAGDTVNAVIKLRPTITFEPADAKIYATVVDDKNLSLFLAGKAYAPSMFTDMDTNGTSTCENRLISTPWELNASVPWTGYNGPTVPEGPSHSYYVILKNGDLARPVEITYDLMRITAA
jgi:hypothetical protein